MRSAYNKVKNIKQTLNTLGLDFMIASETWERPRQDLVELLGSPNYSILSYCRGREQPAVRQDGRLAGKEYPGKTGGGAAIIYNTHTFEVHVTTSTSSSISYYFVTNNITGFALAKKDQRSPRLCTNVFRNFPDQLRLMPV